MNIRNLGWLVLCGFGLVSCAADTLSNKEVHTDLHAEPGAPACEYQAGKDKALILVGQVALRQGELVERKFILKMVSSQALRIVEP